MSSRGSKIFLPPALAWRALVVGSAGTVAASWQSSLLSGNDSELSSWGRNRKGFHYPYPKWMEWTQNIPYSRTQTVLSGMMRKERTLMEGKTNEQKQLSTRSTIDKLYDFVILGNGKTGQTAVQELRKQCPGATIAVVDPMRGQKNSLSPKTEYFLQLAASIEPADRVVRLLDSGEENDGGVVLRYKYAALIATGAHGAPPPSYLIDKYAWPCVLELRPTLFPQMVQKLHSRKKLSLNDDRTQEWNNHSAIPKEKNNSRIFLQPTESRELAVQASHQGQDITILGQGWDALDLAIACATPPSLSLRKFTKRQRKLTKGIPSDDTVPKMRHNRPILLYSGSGPLAHILPQYLVSAVAKRLRSKRIQLQGHTLVRYVGYDDHAKKLVVYTAKTYDTLDSQRNMADWLLVAPEVVGPRGNALIPTHNIPSHLQKHGENRCWYENWSQLSCKAGAEPPLLICYQNDGRIAVNAELCACTGIYAAGSVAKYGNSFTGDAVVAGGGGENAAKAGRVAASNMARHYNHEKSLTNAYLWGNDDDSGTTPFLPIQAKDPFSVWRSDVLSYAPQRSSSLASVGITALCVGVCDSERFTTHGVWWTNQAAQLRFMRELSDLPSDGGDEDTERTRRMKEQVTKSVYGIGVIYYLHPTGRIHGIMTWGLPICNSDSKKLNEALVQQMKGILTSNRNKGIVPGGPDSSAFFTEESKKLVRTAFAALGSETQKRHDNYLDMNDFPRPLHRYTPAWMFNSWFRQRRHRQGAQKRGASDGSGEDLFARSFYDGSLVPDQLPSKPVAGVGFSDPSNQAFQASQSMYEYLVWENNEKRWEENESLACPPIEDALWVKKGHDDRNVNAEEAKMEEFAMQMQRRYSLGSKQTKSSPN